MPFTFSHPAAVLPFMPWSGKRFSVTALVIGSMVPDFEFFFRMRAETDISHTPQGAFLFNIPVTIFLAFLYHGWIRSPLLTNLPPFLLKRVSVYDNFDWPSYFTKHWLVVLYSAVIGVASHFFCDAFTHGYGWFVHRIPVLSSSFLFLGEKIPVYHALQYLSSLILGLMLVFVVMKLPKQDTPTPSGSPFLFYGAVTGVSLVVLAVRFAVSDRAIAGDDVIMSVMGSGMIGVMLVASAFQLFYKK